MVSRLIARLAEDGDAALAAITAARVECPETGVVMGQAGVCGDDRVGPGPGGVDWSAT
jgi:hypothetical protein